MLLALDLGTTTVKALVTDWAGRALAQGAAPVRLFPVSAQGVEQDLEEIWNATLRAIGQAVQPQAARDIEAMGVSSQGGALQVLAGDHQPLGRVISWLDQRGRPYDEALTSELGRKWFLDRIAHGRSGLAIGQLLRLRQDHPALLEPPHRVGFVGDVIVSRLCGQAAHDGTSAALTLLYNPRTRDYDPDVLARLGVKALSLPSLRSPREPAGGLLPAVARRTGLRADLPVAVAIHDQYASALGTGAVRPGNVMVGTGTAWVLLATSEAPPAPAHDDAFVCHHVVDARWGQIVSMVNGGSAITWVTELLNLARRDTETIDRLLELAPPGSAGLTCWPFLAPSTPSGLARTVTARWTGLQLSHQPAHLVRSVVEGLAFELSRHLDFLRRPGQPVEQLIIGGGAAASRVTPQILADVTGLPLRGFSGADASLRGAAVLARGLLEPHASLAEVAEDMLPPARSVEPGPAASVYRDLRQGYVDSVSATVSML